ncbi:hypothetical protein [Desnuesiella massiliensis]|uniref:hypothetical protein n=1 Tax=Desnuesiella massiliensis TaxID=1650662 RepID=UPI0012B5EEDD|nr:hypothetical protein [Desnuesiella massiliensis]
MEIRREETIRKGNTVFCIKSIFNGTKSAKEILITAISKDIEENLNKNKKKDSG